MIHLLVSVLAGLLSIALLFLGMVAALSGGQIGLLWFYLATVLVVFVAMLWRASKRPGPMGWAERIRRGMVSLCLALFAGAVVAIVGYGIASRPPEQKAVAELLKRHQVDLEALKEMAVTDHIETLLDFGNEVSRPEEPFRFKPSRDSGLTAERVSRYRERMHRAGTQRIDVWRDGTVHFSVAGWGGANRGWRMSITWAATPPEPLLPTVDGFPRGKPPGAPNYAYSPLQGPWYVYLIW